VTAAAAAAEAISVERIVIFIYFGNGRKDEIILNALLTS
jgi:hypothetical protein